MNSDIPDYLQKWTELCQTQKDPPPFYCQIPDGLAKFRSLPSEYVGTITTISTSGSTSTSTTTTL